MSAGEPEPWAHEGVIGVDIGGTSIEVVRLDDRGGVTAHSCVPTRRGSALLPGAVAAVEGVRGDEPIHAIGVGVPGQVDPTDGSVRQAVNLGVADRKVPLGQGLAAAFSAPVVVDNDVRAAALGAARHLVPDARVLVFLGIGTGVAAGVVIDGIAHRGRNGIAGEIGHVVVDPAGPPCACGLVGCLEACISGPAIGRRWGDPSASTPAGDLFLAAAAGDRAAQAVAEDVIGHLARAVQWLVFAYGADHVVLGGGVGGLGAPLLDPLRAHLTGMTERSGFAAQLLSAARISCVPPNSAIGARGAALLVPTDVTARTDARAADAAGAASAAPGDGPGRADALAGR